MINLKHNKPWNKEFLSSPSNLAEDLILLSEFSGTLVYLTIFQKVTLSGTFSDEKNYRGRCFK